MKKFVSILLAAMLVFVLAIPAFADDTITISVDASGSEDTNTANEVYKAYKIFDVVKADSITGDVTTDDSIAAQSSDPYVAPKGFAYTISTTSEWYSVVSTNLTGYITLQSIASDSTKKVVKLKDGVANNEATAIAIAGILEANMPAGAASTDVTLTSSANVAPGYYLIVSSIGSNLILGTSDINITQKNKYPTLSKTEKDADATDYAKTVNVAVGDTISYKVSVNVPATAKVDIVITDTLDASLDYKADSLAVKVGENALTAGTDYVVDTASGQTIKVTIKPTAATKNNTVVISYDATVNAKGITTADTNKKNSVVLDFSKFQLKDTTSYVLKASSLYKYDGDTNEKLPGVKFELKQGETAINVTKHADGYYYIDSASTSNNIVETDANGMIIIRGLDADKTYTLTEKETVKGYNMLENPVELSLVADDGTYTADAASASHKIANYQGTVLPSTGSIGTTIFYVIGGVLIAAAGILLITKKRMSREN